jgi:hypothetical protein
MALAGGMPLLAGGAAAALVVGLVDRRRSVAMLGLGALLIAIRLAVGPAPGPLGGPPDGAGPWAATVEAIGSVRDGQQTATIRIAPDGTGDGARLAATLPRYPQDGDKPIVVRLKVAGFYELMSQ